MTEMPRLKITAEDIARVKRQHILDNLSYSVRDAAKILGCKVRKIYHLIETGDLVSGNDTPGKRGTIITARSVEEYNQKRISLAGDDAAGLFLL